MGTTASEVGIEQPTELSFQSDCVETTVQNLVHEQRDAGAPARSEASEWEKRLFDRLRPSSRPPEEIEAARVTQVIMAEWPT